MKRGKEERERRIAGEAFEWDLCEMVWDRAE
jgi:hypothetical protein